MRNRNVRVLAATLIVAAMLVTGCTAKDPERPESAAGGGDPIRIGAVLSLSGTYAGLGTPEKNAIELEVARINEAGGIGGRPIEMVYEDDGTDAAAAQAAVAKLVDQEGVVAVIGATGTGQTMGMRGDIERAQVPQVSMAGGSVITDEFSPWVFQTPWPNRVVVPFTFQRLKDAGITRLAILSDSGGYGKDGLAVTKAQASKFGISIVAEEVFNAGDTDMSAQLTKIGASDAQALWIWSAGSEAAIILKNAADLELRAEMTEIRLGFPNVGGLIVGTPGNARKELIEGAGAAAEGFEFAAGHILLPESYGTDTEAYKVATDFIDRYTAAYGVAPDIFAGHAYDAVHIVADALSRMPEGDIDPSALRDEIERTSGLVGIGGTFTYTAEDHNGLSEKDLVMYRIDSGAWTLAEGK